MAARKPKQPASVVDAVEKHLGDAGRRVPGADSTPDAALAREFARLAMTAEYERDRIAAGRALSEVLDRIRAAQPPVEVQRNPLDALAERRERRRRGVGAS